MSNVKCAVSVVENWCSLTRIGRQLPYGWTVSSADRVTGMYAGTITAMLIADSVQHQEFFAAAMGMRRKSKLGA